MAKSRVQPNRRQNFLRLIGVVAVVGGIVLVYIANRPRADIKVVDSTIPAGAAQGYLLGDSMAPVQVLEFADFECPACGQFATVTEPDVRDRLVKTGKISFRFYDYPLPMHQNTWSASNAAACANDQGKFWEMHDAIFLRQNDWNGIATSSPKKVLKEIAGQVGLDVAAWESCFDSQKHYSRIRANQLEAERRGVGQTPTFIVGGKMIPGAVSFDELQKYVAEATPAAAPATKAP
ncbi:MAG: DsbA family protein [Gemmatimonadaceae bacterium]|nr:DsbA family protein [Gemmatimonadaceae bacterium]